MLYTLIALAAGATVVAANDSLRFLLNEHIASLKFEGIIAALLHTISLFISLFILGVVGSYILERITWNGQLKLYEHYMKGLLETKYSFFYNKEVPAICSNINIATQGVAMLLGSLTQMLAIVTSLVFYGIVIFRLDTMAGWLAIAILPLFCILTRFASGMFVEVQKNLMGHYGQLSVVSQDALFDVANIKAKRAQNFYVQRIVDVLKLIVSRRMKLSAIHEYVTGIFSLLSVVATLVVLTTSLHLSPALEASLGNVMVMHVAIPMFIQKFLQLYNKYIEYQSQLPSLSVLREYDNAPREQSGMLTLHSFESLRTRDVSVAFAGGTTVFFPDLAIDKGEKVLIYGESGCGKSTLFNIVLGLCADYTGEVLINDIPLEMYAIDTVRARVSVALQHQFIPSMTFTEFISLGKLDATNTGQDLLHLLELEEVVSVVQDEVMSERSLSGGEKARIGLAQALAVGSDLLLIDESFSGIDEDMEERIVKEVLRRYADMTVVCVSHRSSTRQYFDKVIHISRV